MSANPEQAVIDEIDRLVDWQLEEGRRRGDGPAATQMRTDRNAPWISYRELAATQPRLRLWSEDGSLIADTDRGDRIATSLEDCPADQALASLECPQPSCDWSLPIEWREPGHGILGPVRRMTPDQIEAWLREHYRRAHGIPGARADSRSAPGIDSINPANGEQPRR